jgi:hypothetical protein
MPPRKDTSEFPFHPCLEDLRWWVGLFCLWSERSGAHKFWSRQDTILRVVQGGSFWVGSIVKDTRSKRFDKALRQQEQF